MADFPSFDLFSEIEDLNRFVDEKCGSKFDFVSLDEQVDLNVGIPSHGILDSDTLLADVSSNALLGDPLLNYIEQNELLELQSASHCQNPETLIPVSLPADPSPLPTSAPDVASSSSTAEKLPTRSVSPKLESSVLRTSEQHISVKADSRAVTSGNASVKAPVRIIVKTRRETPSRMVAPVNLQKPPRSLVKIPRAVPVQERSRLQTIRSGGKLGPSTQSSSSSRSQTPSTQASSRSMQQTGVASSTSLPMSSFEAVSTEESRPFRSLHPRHSSESSEESFSCQGVKRKAYELGPQNDPVKERCRQNAINAKRNRDIKKAHMQELERKVESISRERDELAGENESLREAKLKLEQQVKHLSNVLHNQSKLSSLIEKLGPANVVLGDMITSACEEEIVSSGMCLHVDGDETTIEYCSYCAKKAGKRFSFMR